MTNPLITTSLEPDGVLVATIDMPGLTMNVFSWALMDELDTLMDRVDSDPAVQSVVVASGKATFLAGADLSMVRGFTSRARSATHAEMFEMCGRLGRQFVRLENCTKPWVAAVNGIALGGGLELALACRVRIVADEPRIQLGVPEVRWGLLPGAGGTQRLPRLTGFAPAIELLLSGRSIGPADAVRLGVFARAVPAAQLLDEARAIARSLHGTAHDPASKFARLAQEDVPEWSEAVARDIALNNGVSAEAFELYPAYSAIVDSVLKGARQTLAQATAVEMNQFLRLMFSPVAGAMVRTLFLERLRAERELAAPSTMRLQSFAVGEITSPRQAWADALAKVKLPRHELSHLPADTLDLIDTEGKHHQVALRVLGEAETGGAYALLAPAGPYGRVMELVGIDDTASAMMASLASRMWTLPWRNHGPHSLLMRLQGQTLATQARTALAHAARPDAGDLAFIDVAACLSGLTPAWTGGPLYWLWAAREREAAGLDADGAAQWAIVSPMLEQLCA